MTFRPFPDGRVRVDVNLYDSIVSVDDGSTTDGDGQVLDSGAGVSSSLWKTRMPIRRSPTNSRWLSATRTMGTRWIVESLARAAGHA